MSNIYETIIIGGGMAGMACGLRLREAGKEILMICENIGGRTCYDKKLDMNFGAVFYMENYHNVKKILNHGPLLLKSYSQVMCHRSVTDFFPVLSFRMLRNLPQILKFRRFMKKFVKRYEIYKKNCELMTVKQAMEKDPFMKDLYFKTAKDLIKELKILKAGEDLISQFVYGCTGTDVEGLNALDFCNCAQGLVMPIYKFSFNESYIEKKLGNVLREKVIKIEKTGNLYTVTTEENKILKTENLVVATPAITTKELLGLNEIRKSSKLISYLVSGVPKNKYKKHDLHIFADHIPLIYFYRRHDNPGEYEIFSVEEIDLGEYFETFEILGRKKWKNALYVKGDIILDQDLGENLYIAGDHNGLGMEPAAISGIYAANRILEKA